MLLLYTYTLLVRSLLQHTRERVIIVGVVMALRRRHHDKRLKKGGEVSVKEKEKEEEEEEEEEEEDAGVVDMTTLKIYGIITAVVVLPYCLYLVYLWLHLQSGWLFGQVVVKDTDARQVLIVGTQSSGTTEMTRNLQQIGLEVAHETSETTWDFARDGTVSWFHGIRFLKRPRQTEVLRESVAQICREAIRNVGFHPSIYRVPRRGCSYRVLWDDCWARECADLIQREFGCANLGRGACETPFHRTLVQARHPMRTVESLVMKFCESLDAEKPQSEAFSRLLAALFPDQREWGPSCVTAMGWYVLRYMEAMVDARDAGVLHGIYQIETTDACGVAELARVIGEDAHPLRQSTAVKVASACDTRSSSTSSSSHSVDDDKPVSLRANRRNKGRISLAYESLRYLLDQGGEEKDADLEDRMRQLASVLGYEE